MKLEKNNMTHQIATRENKKPIISQIDFLVFITAKTMFILDSTLYGTHD